MSKSIIYPHPFQRHDAIHQSIPQMWEEQMVRIYLYVYTGIVWFHPGLVNDSSAIVASFPYDNSVCFSTTTTTSTDVTLHHYTGQSSLQC